MTASFWAEDGFCTLASARGIRRSPVACARNARKLAPRNQVGFVGFKQDVLLRIQVEGIKVN
jgi:hypothetical protein